MSSTSIQMLIDEQLQATERLMQAQMTSEVPLAQMVMSYAINNGGKRFRPMLTLLSAGLCAYQNERAITLAALIEFIHNATLLHDDVVDESKMRRGKDSANIAFGNAASVLVGDFLYTRAFELMVSLGEMRVLAVMSQATNLIASGEVMQLSNLHNPEVDEARYFRVIELKTAVLFSAACECAGILAGVEKQKIDALRQYGRCLGMAFQIIDDLLDYHGDEARIGKALGDDLAEGKPTLPLIRALERLQEEDALRLREIIRAGEREAIAEVVALLAKTDAVAYSLEVARKMCAQAREALAVFADNAYKKALLALADNAIERLA